MSETSRTEGNRSQSPTSLSIEALEEIVHNCQRNEERLHELERHTRHERKKAERLLRETHRTMDNRDSRNTTTNTDTNNTINNSYTSEQKSKQQQQQRSAKEFFVSIEDEDDEDDENEKHRRRQNNTNNNKLLSQDKHLLERVEKLLAGDGTTTSSDVMSSQERQKKVIEKSTSPVEDDLDERSLNIKQEKYPETRQIPSACSIEYDLPTVDHLLSERTPINNHRMKSDIQLNRDNNNNNNNQIKKTINFQDEKHLLEDERDRQFYERLNNYVQTGRFVSPDPDKQNLTTATTTTNTDDETYQYKPRSAPKLNNKDDELADLARRCEDLLSRLHTQRNHAEMLENSTHHYDYYQRKPSPSYEPKQYHRHHHHHHYRSKSPLPPPPPPSIRRPLSPPLPELPPPMSLQQALELLRPEFISRSRQRARRIRLLREEREHNTEIDRERQQMLLFSCTNCCTNPTKRTLTAPITRRSISYTLPLDQSNNSSRLSLTYRQMKQATKKKYDQLPEVKDRRCQNQMDEIRRRNILRAKLFRTRLRQHVARHGRTDIDESLTMINT